MDRREFSWNLALSALAAPLRSAVPALRAVSIRPVFRSTYRPASRRAERRWYEADVADERCIGVCALRTLFRPADPRGKPRPGSHAHEA
jgi:hypothetical protein